MKRTLNLLIATLLCGLALLTVLTMSSPMRVVCAVLLLGASLAALIMPSDGGEAGDLCAA